MTSLKSFGLPPAHALVLVVEDEAIVAKDLAASLRALSYRICGIARSGEQAVALAEELRPDLVLMDIHLEGLMDGVEAARLIRSRIDAPVVFLTAFADDATLERVKTATPYGYIIKPFDERDLHVTIVMALCRHRAWTELDEKVRRRTEELAQTELKFRQLEAVDALGLHALRSPDVRPVLKEAAAVLQGSLAADIVGVFERRESGRLDLVDGAGWHEGTVGQTSLEGGHGSSVGFTVLEQGPVVMTDLREERRFVVPPHLRHHQVLSGVNVLIAVPGQCAEPHGVLGVYFRVPRTFLPGEIAFVGAVANVLASAIARSRAEAEKAGAERMAESERARRAQAEERIRQRDEFISIASHELRTPLTSLQIQVQSLVERAGELEPRVAHKVQRAARSTERLVRLVDTLLDVARVTSGALELYLEPLELGAVVRDLIDRLADEARWSGCELRLAVPAPVTGSWDKVRVEQVLTNLLSNAFKYGRGQPVDVVVASEAGGARVSVTDRGPGISSQDLPRIFERFERASSVRHYGGLGLGLYVARQITQAHGGSIEVASVEGEGSTFTVHLPSGA